MVISEDQIRNVRAQLEGELEESSREIEDIDEQVRSFGQEQNASEGVDNHIGDDADTVYEQERLLTIRGELVERKLKIERALQKMDEGAYGVCERCGQPIAPERLEALPFVALCINCQEIEDRHGSWRR